MEKEKINQLAVFYYSRKDIQEAIFQFCQHRETVPQYYEGFGKRPDTLEYPGDIISQVNNGATSLHCSEELWNNPLAISTEPNKEQLNNLRVGWDLLIDIDCKWFDYSKIAALSVIKVLKGNNIKNFGIKFSGSKGFHIIVPWDAFPEEVNGIKTREMFPEWARIIAEYIKVQAGKYFEEQVTQSGDEYLKLNKGDDSVKMKCKSCGDISQKFQEITFYCPRCKISETAKVLSSSKSRKCAQCREEMIKKNEREFYVCSKCKIDSRKDSGNFIKSSLDSSAISAFDIVLVSPRHLFRCPYSLHEKTGFASTVLNESEISNFKPSDADVIKIKIRDFYPEARKDEARNLLISALEWHGERERQKHRKEEKSEPRTKGKFQDIQVDKSSMKYPPSINKILEGMEDGKKRALFILINFFRSLNFSREETEKKIEEWNKKNKKQLKEAYIKAQLDWAFRHKKMLPPNYDKTYYKDIGIYPDDEELRLKNPVSYTIKKSRWSKK